MSAPGRVARSLVALGAVGTLAVGLPGPAPAVTTRSGEVATTTTSPVASRRMVTPRDPRLVESSGVVDRGATVVLTNDSGSCACLYVVSTRTGRTLGVTRWRSPVRDVEALAPAGPRAVWVGDVGDNRSARRRIVLLRVPVGTRSRTVRPSAYALAYPRGAHDAESVVVDRRGRVSVVTKSFAGGTVFATTGPLRRDRVNRLRRVARVAELATDAALSLDGRSVVVRGPAAAGVYAYPTWRRLGGFALPRQRQGEGVAVGPGGRVLLASEGRRSPLLAVTPPAALAAALAGRPAPSPSATPSPSPSTTPTPSTAPTASASPRLAATTQEPRAMVATDRDDEPWLLWTIPVVIVLGALGIGLGLRRRTP
ncbi:hypothetical protein GCM10027596_06830 [Nocardioides korecus]